MCKSSVKVFYQRMNPSGLTTRPNGPNVWCEVGLKLNITDNSIFFKRSSYDRKGMTSAVLEGKFTSSRKKHMDIDSPGGVYRLQEDIIYMSENGSCAVIKVTTSFGGTQETYDLRVTNSSLKSGPTEKCISKFSKHEGEGKVIYDAQCQGILASDGVNIKI
ncbi:uncharacterized protein LOC119457340 [Dermacentor silvarum]|uniref:uncharacterized protein LOC119457340 n=1 Tax=Dermacentor silvarum TaxID=543639 RepID=UPI0021018F2C|nr:uncharacterized protein LOC119457340 [Dermacentor silvarum]